MRRGFVLLFVAVALETASARRVGWFTSRNGVKHSVSGLNNEQFARVHSDALTGYMPCCGMWSIGNDGSFSSGAKDYFNDLVKMGVEIVPVGHIQPDALISEAWATKNAVEDATNFVKSQGWRGMMVDDEYYSHGKIWNPELPDRYRDFIGNMSSAFAQEGLVLYVDICSTWTDSMCGNLNRVASYADRAPSAVFMDMCTYHGPGKSGDLSKVEKIVKDLAAHIPTSQIAIGIGLTAPGYRNASCMPQNPSHCDDYGWDTGSDLSNFLKKVDAAGIKEVDIWRADLNPPPGTTADIPQYFIDSMVDFLQGNTER